MARKKPSPITIQFKHLSTAWGYAYPDERRIELAAAMRPEKEMEIAIHEALHIELPDLDETAVVRTSKSICDVLLRLNYWRKIRDDE